LINLIEFAFIELNLLYI